MKARMVVTVFAVVSTMILTGAAGWSAELASTAAEPSAVSAPTTATVANEYKLPFPKGRVFRPMISGDWVVAIYNTDMTNATPTAQVLAYNLSTKQLQTLWPAGSGWPDVQGNFASWTGKSATQITFRTLRGEPNRVMPSNMLVCDLTTGRYYSPALRTGGAAYPVVYGNCVAYVAGTSVYLVDLLTGDQRQLSDPSNRNRLVGPSIGGDYVTWATADGPENAVCAHKISTGQILTIDSEPGVKYHYPRTDGTIIVWTEFVNNVGSVYAYDLTTNRQAKIADGHFAHVDNGLVVYEKPVKGVGYPVYGIFPFRGGQEFRISSGTADQGPSVSGNRVIWCKDNVVYCAELDFGDRKPIAKPLSPSP